MFKYVKVLPGLLMRGRRLNNLLSMLPDNIAEAYNQRAEMVKQICKEMYRLSSKINRGMVEFTKLSEEVSNITGSDTIKVTEMIRMDTLVTVYLNYSQKTLMMMTSSMYNSTEVLNFEHLAVEDFVTLFPTNGKIVWNIDEIKNILISLRSLQIQHISE